MLNYDKEFSDDDCSDVSYQSSDWSGESKQETIFDDKKPDLTPTNAIVQKL